MGTSFALMLRNSPRVEAEGVGVGVGDTTSEPRSSVSIPSSNVLS